MSGPTVQIDYTEVYFHDLHRSFDRDPGTSRRRSEVFFTYEAALADAVKDAPMAFGIVKRYVRSSDLVIEADGRVTVS